MADTEQKVSIQFYDKHGKISLRDQNCWDDLQRVQQAKIYMRVKKKLGLERDQFEIVGCRGKKVDYCPDCSEEKKFDYTLEVSVKTQPDDEEGNETGYIADSPRHDKPSLTND